ncbi:hypothetical protein TWF730_004452 [Orbilia blumenaviensis]|uniref:Clr5 domain-containing protein n=1 Tax=Orbilia blumenaviensis TaxID=1796055 RepID=A0AAV9TYI5_9PEZI
MELGVVEPQPAKTSRPYHKLKDLEQYKSFVLQKHGAGMRQKAILLALKSEIGVDIEPHRLKRMLDKWGASKRNLTKKRKAHIQKVVVERRRGKKTDPQVTLGRTNRSRVLTQDDIDEIVNMEDLEDVKPNADGMELCTPSSSPDQCETTMAAPPKIHIYDEDSHSDGDGSWEPYSNTDRNEVLEDVSTGTISEGTIEGEEGEEEEAPELESDQESAGSNPRESIEQLQRVITAQIKALGIQEDEEIDILDDFLEADSAEMEDIEGLVYDSSDSEEIYWKDPLLQWYSRRYVGRYYHYINMWKNIGRAVVRSLRDYLAKGIPFDDAAERASAEAGEEYGVLLPYKAWKTILQMCDDCPCPFHEDRHKRDEEEGMHILSYIEDLLEAVMEHPSFSMENLIAHWDYEFTDSIIHLPRLIREYGVRSFFTALCLRYIYDMLAWYNFGFFGDALSPLACCSLRNFERIGMGLNTLSWSQFYLKLTRCKERDRLFERLRLHYGVSHPILVQMEIDSAIDLIKQKHSKSPAGRKTLTGLVSKISSDLEYCSRNFSAVYTSDMLMNLTELLGLLPASDAMKFESFLQDRISSSGGFTGSESVGASFYAAAHCTSGLGIAYAQAENYSRSLEMLFRAYGMMAQDTTPAYQVRLVTLLQEICWVVDIRGPVLYLSLQPMLVDFQKHISKNRKSANWKQIQVFRRLCAKYEACRKEYLKEEYSNILTHRSARRSVTPDLQLHFYYESVESWMYSQGVYDIPDPMNLGGQIMEIDSAETGADIPMGDSIKVES